MCVRDFGVGHCVSVFGVDVSTVVSNAVSPPFDTCYTAYLSQIASNDSTLPIETEAIYETDLVMWFRKKKESDVELEGMVAPGQKAKDDHDDTEYRPVNWKRIFLTPKYIRTFSYRRP